MKRLIRKSNLENDYKGICKLTAQDINGDELDEDVLDNFAKDIIDEIKSGKCFSEFAVLAKEYYDSIDKEPICENIIDDIAEFM